MFGLLSLGIILGYAFIMMLGKVTKFEPNDSWPGSLLDIIKVGLPVAITEEFLFRFILLQVILFGFFKLDILTASIFTSLIFAGAHFWWGMHKNALHMIELFIGLFIFSMITCKLVFVFPVLVIGKYVYGWQNVLWHAGAIYGVQLTSSLFTKEVDSDWPLWDESHALLRAIPMWLILAYVLIKI